jgi:hypothetical protein
LAEFVDKGDVFKAYHLEPFGNPYPVSKVKIEATFRIDSGKSGSLVKAIRATKSFSVKDFANEINEQQSLVQLHGDDSALIELKEKNEEIAKLKKQCEQLKAIDVMKNEVEACVDMLLLSRKQLNAKEQQMAKESA